MDGGERERDSLRGKVEIMINGRKNREKNEKKRIREGGRAMSRKEGTGWRLEKKKEEMGAADWANYQLWDSLTLKSR